MTALAVAAFVAGVWALLAFMKGATRKPTPTDTRNIKRSHQE